ncbi:hypothetical protein MRX96_015626 [Rhipicephalus microplus]
MRPESWVPFEQLQFSRLHSTGPERQATHLPQQATIETTSQEPASCMFEEAVKKSAIEGSEHKVPASNNERLIFSFLYLIIVVVALCVALVIVSQQTPPPASTSTALGLYDDVFEPAKFLASAAQVRHRERNKTRPLTSPKRRIHSY